MHQMEVQYRRKQLLWARSWQQQVVSMIGVFAWNANLLMRCYVDALLKEQADVGLAKVREAYRQDCNLYSLHSNSPPVSVISLGYVYVISVQIVLPDASFLLNCISQVSVSCPVSWLV